MSFAGDSDARPDVDEEAAPQYPSPKPAAHTAHAKGTPAFPSDGPLPAGNRPSVPGKTCAFCGTDSTPVWRSGPNKEHLCNRCGLQAARKKRKREAATLLVLKTSDPKVPRQQGGSTAGASLPGHHAALGQASARAVPSVAGAHRRDGTTPAAAGAAAVPAGLSSLSGVHLVVLPPPSAPASLPAPDSGSQGQRPSPSPGPGGVTGNSNGGGGNGVAAPSSPPAPRLVQNATLVLEESGGAAPLSHPSCLPVCLAAYDCWGQRLLASERFDVMPHLEYDPAYGCFVYDSGQEWWLLLPRAEQTEVFKALMHKFAMMKAVRMGLLPRPSLELDCAPHPAAPSAGGQPLRPGAPRGALAGPQGPAAAAAAAGALHAPLLAMGPLPTLQPPAMPAVVPGLGPSAAGCGLAPSGPAPHAELEASPPAAAPAAATAQGPDLMMALSGLLAGAGWAIQQGVVPQQKAEQPAGGSGDEAGGLRSGEPSKQANQEQQEQLAGDAVAETAIKPDVDDSVLGEVTAHAGSSALPSQMVPPAGAAAAPTGGAAITGEGTSVPRSPGKPPLPPGAAGKGLPPAAPAVGPPQGGGFASLLGAAAGKGSLDFTDLWEPSLSGFNSRALSGLTQLLAFGPVGSTGLALSSPAAKEGAGSGGS
ncbi:hypothetical protein N2152v2_003465 [Parachlorella kessleri]